MDLKHGSNQTPTTPQKIRKTQKQRSDKHKNAETNHCIFHNHAKKLISRHPNFKTEENVSIITLDDGKVNAFSPAMIAEVDSLLDQVPTDKGAVMFTGREGMFTAGFDLKVMATDPDAAVGMIKSGFKMLQRIFSFPRPVVSACSGHAIAMGAFLLCSSCLLYTSPSPRDRG